MCTGALAYADDIALLAATATAMRMLLSICEYFGKKFSVFLMQLSQSACWSHAGSDVLMTLRFTLMEMLYHFVNDYTHLGALYQHVWKTMYTI